MRQSVSEHKFDLDPYKEPLTEVEDGFGYMGTLAKTKDGKYVQCHFCGELVKHLGVHAAKKHNIKGSEYRWRYGLAANTSLVAPISRERYVRQYQNLPSDILLKRLTNLKKGREVPHTATRPKSLEQKNKEGTCPDQLIDKIELLAKKLERTPSLREFSREYKGLIKPIYSTFGSWSNALLIAKLPKAHNGARPHYTRKQLLDIIIDFQRKHNRRPYSSDLKQGMPTAWTYIHYFGSWSNALKAANQLEEYKVK